MRLTALGFDESVNPCAGKACGKTFIRLAFPLEDVACGDRDRVLVVPCREGGGRLAGGRIGRDDRAVLGEHALVRAVMSILQPDGELVGDEVLPGGCHLPERLVGARSEAALVAEDLAAEDRRRWEGRSGP